MNDLAYIKGVMDGDGDIDRGNQHRLKHGLCKPRLRLQVTSKDFADSFSEALTHLGLIPRRYETDRTRTLTGYTWTNHIYIVRASCPESLIEELSSLNVEQKELAVDYIRGFFQSEGSVCHSHHKIAIYNKDVWLLNRVKQILLTFGIEPSFRNYSYHVPFLEIHNRKAYDLFLKTFGEEKAHD